MTAPYAADVAELITGSLRHEVAVQVKPHNAEPFDLDVERDLSITFSEDWAPYVQADLTAALPEEDALDQIDPRKNTRLLIRVGYTYPNNTTEVFPLADLGIRERPVKRPDGTLTLDAGSDEYRAQDYKAMYWAGMERAGLNESVRWLAGFAVGPETPRVASDFPAKTGAAALAELEVSLGDDYWGLMEDAATRTGKRVYCDEFRTWRITSRPETAGKVSHDLAVGENGTIMLSQSTLSREPWYNAVCLQYRWTDAERVEHVVIGRALVQSGEFSVSDVGHKVHYEEITRPINQAAADAAAAAKLRNLVTRGRSLELEAAAAYWLRPGATVRVTLPTGPPGLHLVQSVTFKPLDGRMRVSTRQPLNVTITNGE